MPRNVPRASAESVHPIPITMTPPRPLGVGGWRGLHFGPLRPAGEESGGLCGELSISKAPCEVRVAIAAPGGLAAPASRGLDPCTAAANPEALAPRAACDPGPDHVGAEPPEPAEGRGLRVPDASQTSLPRSGWRGSGNRRQTVVALSPCHFASFRVFGFIA